jgi:hypothetical protein
MLKKTFVHYNEAWYKRPDNTDEIFIRIETDDEKVQFSIE